MRFLENRSVVGGEHEGAAVLEALDVAGDDADLGLIGEVGREVGELQVDLVARRCPMSQADADLLALEHRSPLMAGLRDQRDGWPGEVAAEGLERVQVGVRAEQPGLARGDEIRGVDVRASRLACRSR